MSGRLLGGGLLVGVYALTVGGFSPGDLAVGAVAAFALLALFRGSPYAPAPAAGGELARRAVAFVPWAAVVAGKAALGSWRVGLAVLGIRRPGQPGLVAVPVGERSETAVAVSALAATLSPGSVLVDVDEERRVMVFHLLDASDPEAFRASMDAAYRRQRRVAP